MNVVKVNELSTNSQRSSQQQAIWILRIDLKLSLVVIVVVTLVVGEFHVDSEGGKCISH